MYNDHELNFAIHVRLGDRMQLLTDTEASHLDHLGRFMNDVTESVVLRGLDPPAFHVFSETADPCPSEVDGTFAEFPKWPVEMDQVRTSWALGELHAVRDAMGTQRENHWLVVSKS